MTSQPEEPENGVNLNSILTKYKKVDLVQTIPSMFPGIAARLPQDFQLLSKRSIIGHIADELLNLDLSLSLITSKLDMQFIRTNPNRKKWGVVKLIDVKEGFSADSFYDPDFFMESLEKNLSRSEFHCKVYSEFDQEAIWTVGSFQPIASRRKRKSTNKFFLIHYPHLPYVLHSDIKLPVLQLVQTALRLTFQCRKLKTLKLTSRNVGSVLQLALQKDGCRFNGGPMPAVIREHHVPIEDEPVLETPNVIDEDGRLALNKIYMTKLYGKYEQPPLETLVIRTESSRNLDDEDAEKAKCQIVFSGKNVMEGLRSLVHRNAIQQPMHYALERLPQLGSNSIQLTEQN